MFQTHALADIIKIAAIRIAGHGQRGGGEHSGFKIFKKGLLQDLGNVKRRRLQHNMGLSSTRAAAFTAIFDPEDCVLVC